MDQATRERKPLALVHGRKEDWSPPPSWPRPTRSSSACRCFDVSCARPQRSRAIKLVSEELIRKHRVLPLFKRGNRLFVGMSDPTNTHALDEIKFHTNLTVEPILVDEDQLARTIDQWLEAQRRPRPTRRRRRRPGEPRVDRRRRRPGQRQRRRRQGATTRPVVKFVNKVLVDAIKRGASDIHFEPYETEYRVRLRIDGLLKQVAKAPVKLQPAHRRAPEGHGAAGHRREARAAGRPHQAQPVQDQADRLPRQHPARRCSARRSCCVSSTAAPPSWASTSSATRTTRRSCSSTRC